MRSIGLDLGRKRGEAAMVDETGRTVGLGRLEVSKAALTAFARTLRPDDRVALEASTNSFAIAKLLAPSVGQVIVSNPLRTKAIASAKVKTDAIDARTLAELLAAGYQPDEAAQGRCPLVRLSDRGQAAGPSLLPTYAWGEYRGNAAFQLTQPMSIPQDPSGSRAALLAQ